MLVILTDFAVIVDIPFFRQILGFIFLTILPGLLVLQILKLRRIEPVEAFILSIGVSISVLMFFGLLYNNLSLGLGYKSPLSTIPLLVMFNAIIIVFILVLYFVNKDSSFSMPIFNSTSEKAFLILPILFPALGIFGTYYMNITDNNIISVFLLVMIPVYVAFICFYSKKFPKRLYPVIILLIGISLTQMFALRSNHIIGADRHSEYYLFQVTLNNLHWSILEHSTLDTCLSISLLPTIYQSFLNVSPELLFKTLIPLLFSISPLAIYILSKKYVDELYAFLASFLFMSQLMFVSYPGGRTNLAILFFALIMVVVFCERMAILEKRILIIIFIVSIIFSHYATTYILLIIMFIGSLGAKILLKKYKCKKNPVVTLSTLILFSVIIFLWYSQITDAAFDQGVIFFEKTFSQLANFFVVEMRNEDVYIILGEGILEKGIPQRIEFISTWLILFFIATGIIAMIYRYKNMLNLELNYQMPEFLKDKFEVEYSSYVIGCFALLGLFIALPYVSKGYGMQRTYAFSSTLLSTFFVLGGIYLSKCVLSSKKILINGRKNCIFNRGFSKHNSNALIYVIVLSILISNFLSVTGITYEIFNYPKSMVINSEGNEYDTLFIHDEESYSAKWLNRFRNESLKIYSDNFGDRRLVSQGLINVPIYNDSIMEFIEKNRSIKDGFVYLRYCGVVKGKLLDKNNQWHNLTDYEEVFRERNLIYSNSGSEVLL